VSWGTGAYGLTSWGIGTTTPVPVLIGITPGLVARRGGDVIQLFGTGFTDPALVEVLSGPVVPYTLEGTCYVFDPEFDVKRNVIWAGTPALDDGVYHLRVTTDGGPSAVLVNALTYELFSEEVKALKVRQGLNWKWRAGRRMLVTGEAL